MYISVVTMSLCVSTAAIYQTSDCEEVTNSGLFPSKGGLILTSSDTPPLT